ncbi:MAG: electron transfer flavoprotein subunit alpha/FixB family protein [Alphaproteobacteria bacterium]|nr:electron transfer flavoprotein subunit alpha/FixB family protein [Alphaproteobacteria bacterium]
MGTGNILAVVELEEGAPTQLTLELIALASVIAEAKGGKVIAACLGAGVGEAVGRDLIAGGADEVHTVDDELFEPYQADAWLPDLEALSSEVGPVAILMPHTNVGADLAPRLAFRLGSSAATGCVDVDAEDLCFTRPCYGGIAREQVSFRSTPAIATIEAKSFDALPRDDTRSGAVIARDAAVTPDRIRTRVVERDTKRAAGVRLENANVIVAGGRGIGGPDGFADAKELADVLDGAVGASRVACDLGWCPPGYQIGLSGKTVAPDLYIALGISGAGQHMAGCGNAKTIVAINTDKDADIFASARFGVVGDCREILPHLVEEMRSIKR